MIGNLVSLDNGPERDVQIVVTASEIRSEISSPPGAVEAQDIDYYEVAGLQEHDDGLITLTIVLTSRRRIRFYSTHSKFDMALLLDQLDGTIGQRRRQISPNDSEQAHNTRRA